MNANKEVKQAILFFAVCALGALVAYYFVYTQQEELTILQGQIGEKEQSIAGLQAQVAKKEEYESRLRNIKESLSQFITILPSPLVATEERLYELIAEKTKRAQFKIDEIQIVHRKGGAKKKGAAFKELSVRVQAEATYEQFLKFLNSLEAHETFLAVKEFNVQPKRLDEDVPENAPLPLGISLSVSTYRYEPGQKKKR